VLERFAESGHGDVRKLKGAEDRWRLRVGAWRVIFTVAREGHALLILRVLPRGKAYR
jgi:mRNA-degrading endonuclease RelE of RelBE toxin-antitoxin system